MFQLSRVTSLAMLILGLAGAAQAMAAGDGQRGQQLAAKCAACHGPQGKGAGNAPGIAGMSVETFVAALNAYKSGARKHPTMANVTKNMSDADMADLAAYYATK